jgi:hypothetical protein
MSVPFFHPPTRNPCFVVYSMAQASKAIIPRDAGGPFGRRIGVSVGGSTGWGLRVGAYVTHRASASDFSRYALVVLNCESAVSMLQSLNKISLPGDDSAARNLNPQPIKTTIEFRGLQVIKESFFLQYENDSDSILFL